MAKQAHQQQKLLVLRQIFLQETDEEHGLTMQQILARLAECGIPAERKSVYSSIELLNQSGLDILRERRNGRTLYFAAARDFETAELRLLADAVASSRFITAKKSDQLLQKLAGLTSRHFGSELRRQVHVASRIKNMNETIFYLIDELNRAIDADTAIRFCYFDWALEGARLVKRPRHGGRQYLVSPWQLLWQNEFYYLIAFDHDAGAIRHYRVDRMDGIRFTGAKRQGAEAFRRIRMEDYAARLFGMFGGETERIALSYTGRLLDHMINRFGRERRPRRYGEEGRLLLYADVIPSLPFFGWLLSLGPEVTLEEPQTLKERYIAVLRQQLEKENDHGKAYDHLEAEG